MAAQSEGREYQDPTLLPQRHRGFHVHGLEALETGQEVPLEIVERVYWFMRNAWPTAAVNARPAACGEDPDGHEAWARFGPSAQTSPGRHRA